MNIELIGFTSALIILLGIMIFLYVITDRGKNDIF